MQAQVEEPGFWDNSDNAARVSKHLAEVEEEVAFWEGLKKEIEELTELAGMAEHDTKLRHEIEARIQDIEKKYAKEEFRLFLSGPYDRNDAYLTIYSGAGGLDAQGWAEMLLRMYERYFERKGYETHLRHVARGEEGGIKEATLEVRARYAYGFLRREAGVHRLVRISPYSSQKLRHTSFALVDVVPKIEEVDSEAEIEEDELRIDTFRASGPGGQNVNMRDTAVRITHIPTGITASSQSERSQAVNKEKALELLRSKLYMVRQTRQKKELRDLKGAPISAEWGHQIRSYVLHPYQMVKDHRTDFETSNTEAVLDGDLDGFIDAEIRLAR